MIPEVIAKVVEGERLSLEEARETMSSLMRGEASDAQIASLLTALRMRGESAQEIAGFARAMRDSATTISPSVAPLVDTCGTGGDGLLTFNISTAAALVAAGAGVYVAKHGNRGVSSPCGSADVLEALGVNIDMEPCEVEECIEKVGIGFLFAPRFHPAMRHVMRARREMGIPTAFNLLGPLVNPAGVRSQVLGVGVAGKAPLLAAALAEMGMERALVVRGEDGMDELSITTVSRIWDVRAEGVREYVCDPRELGIRPSSLAELAGGSAAENARIIRDEILAGVEGPKRDATLLNAAAALVAAGRADHLSEAMEMARESIDSGAALRVLEKWVEFSSERTGKNAGE